MIYCANPDCQKPHDIIPLTKAELKLYRVSRSNPDNYRENLKVYFCNVECFINEQFLKEQNRRKIKSIYP